MYRKPPGSCACLQEIISIKRGVVYIFLSYQLFWTSDSTFRYNIWTHQPGSHKRKASREFFFLQLPSAVLALIFIAKRIQPSLVDRKSNFVYPRHGRPPLVEHDVKENPSSCDCAEIRTHVPTLEGFEVTN